MKHVILFDLDGTIIDSSEGILGGFMYTMDFYGVPARREDFYPYIGPPLRESFVGFFGEAEADAAVAKYREYYNVRGMYECRLYDGVKELLERLHAAGRSLALATSKGEYLAVAMMEHLGVAPLLTAIAGQTKDRNDKTAILRHALELTGTDPSDAVMVGDRKYDLDSARALGVESVGVLYGFGSREELVAHRADHLAETPAEVGDIVLGL